MKLIYWVPSYYRHKSSSEYHTASYKFTAVNIDELLRDDQNFISHVVELRDSDNIKF